MVQNKTVTVEVVYAGEYVQKLIVVAVEEGASIEAVIEQSGILVLFPEIDLTRQKVGVFSHPRLLTDTIKAGDRIEIYRPLKIDPMEARRAKAKKNSPKVKKD